ncbi:MAG: 3-dehydroquinate synthase [Candidatus Margulisbacteria bacterium]|nr:3-dehydroquinate synthase [Candidatus Margulisiibacteriota bacterium]MBU1021626.1 3-dehydroquinate synthase [Candidatus Margulisiibacteriota bacterium]MBU1728776.1 3-dehydroquinate synthase [Candidatus Margulisiibacteriota bacterium]MBU1955742.1 3-dehydroquinate synthase [Candidatus Margulisiibacteriota bacterium]
MGKVKVELGDRSYEIFIGSGILENFGKLAKEKKLGPQIVIITDPLVWDLHGAPLRKGLKDEGLKFNVLTVPRGERYKNIRSAVKLYDSLVKIKAHRDSTIVAFGGGVIGDLAGFVAATYMRGVTLVQIPTTLLAQVDSSIGGKTGVNHPKGKNLIGVFCQPQLVYIDVKTLTTLPERELQTGLAEVVKYGVIADDAFFKFVETNVAHLTTAAFETDEKMRAAMKVWERIVEESCKIKARVVSKDERESGLRMILNFGHTIGHSIETVTKYAKYNHGEAVAVGMVAAIKLSNTMGITDAKQVERLESLLQKLNLPTSVDKLSSRKIFNNLLLDKKVKGEKLHFVLPDKIGKVVIKTDIPDAKIKKVLKTIGCR